MQRSPKFRGLPVDKPLSKEEANILSDLSSTSLQTVKKVQKRKQREYNKRLIQKEMEE